MADAASPAPRSTPEMSGPMESDRLIAEQPCWLCAFVIWEGGQQVLVVKRSPLLAEDDTDMEPVWSFLREQCSSVGRAYSRPDERMMFGQAMFTEHTVYVECPGAEVEHRCRERMRAA